MIDRAIFSLFGVKKVLAALVCFAVLQACVIAAQVWSLAAVIVSLWEGFSLASQTLSILVFFICFVVRQVLVSVQDTYLAHYGAARSDDLRKSLLSCIFSQGAAAVQRYGTGNLSTLVLEGVDQVETYIRLILPKTVGVVVIPFILLIFIFGLDWVSGIIALIAFPFIIMYMVILGHTAQDEAAKQHATFKMLSNTFIDALRGIDTLKVFGRGKSYGGDIYRASERFREATMKTLRVATLSSSVLDLFATGSLAAVAIMLGFRLVGGEISFFPALVILFAVPEYFKPVKEFASDYHASLDGKNSFTSISRIINDVDEKKKQVGGPSCVTPQAGELCHIEARGIRFSYAEHCALDDISFDVRGPLRVGIVGASGAGKSTLINLLGGFIRPDSGIYAVEGCAIDDVASTDWRRRIAYIPQSPYIFHATLKENLTFYHPAASDEDIQRAVHIMGLEQLVESLPQGLETPIGEGSRQLSGGQAQRIALSRAFLDSERRILLFDEPTAHLDIETELELKTKMLEFMEDKLVFFATHRLHWMDDMDVVFVMERGRIVEVGAPQELFACKGAYRRLVDRLGGDDT